MTCLDLAELGSRWQVAVGDKSLLGTQKPTVGSGSSTTKTALRGDLLPTHSRRFLTAGFAGPLPFLPDPDTF